MRSKQFIFIIGMLCFYSTSLLSHNGLDIRFFDSGTGLAIQTDKITVRHLATNTDVKVVEGEELAIGQPFQLEENKLLPGGYQIIVDKKGFVPISTYLESDNMEVDEINFYLQPIINVSKVRDNRVRSLEREQHTVVVGYVTDINGLPLANVQISALDKRFSTQTDGSGYFEAYIPVNEENELIDLVFAKSGFESHIREYVMIWSNGSWIYQVKLNGGAGERYVADRQIEEIDNSRETFKSAGFKYPAHHQTYLNSILAGCIPASVRAGYNCSCNSCGSVNVHSLQDYIKRVLPHVWIASWGNLAGGIGIHSLRAGSVSVRSYGIWHVNNPLTGSYDICGTACCQIYVNSTNAITNQAIDYTNGVVVKEKNTSIVARSENASENNNLGGGTCGNGYVMRDDNTPGCISDPVCTGRAFNGHGQNMCQWGTARWASGQNTPSTAAHAYGTKDWLEIVEHYYPDYEISNCGCVSNLVISETFSTYHYWNAGNSINSTSIVLPGADVTFTAGNYVQLNPGFDARTGTLFEAFIMGCPTSAQKYMNFLDEQQSLIDSEER